MYEHESLLEKISDLENNIEVLTDEITRLEEYIDNQNDIINDLENENICLQDEIDGMVFE